MLQAYCNLLCYSLVKQTIHRTLTTSQKVQLYIAIILLSTYQLHNKKITSSTVTNSSPQSYMFSTLQVFKILVTLSMEAIQHTTLEVFVCLLCFRQLFMNWVLFVIITCTLFNLPHPVSKFLDPPISYFLRTRN